ncbi:sigma factor-like helix-turn-helix DNA-binding protein [Kribbella sp. NPDC050281]|uniref:sigma factor-like helix-turn-helix DNA-binding protein n=1 Tax=Kribbella sp. NPDC050281 TaxID=3155515 RepID=UPI003411EFB0
MSVGAATASWERERPAAVLDGAAESADGDLDEALAVFLGERRRLTAIAAMILRSVTEAEDVVQEVWLRWQKTDRATVCNARALLVTMTTHCAINVRRSARRRHEVYGSSVPDAADPDASPVTDIEQSEALEEAVMLILARLTANERAAYVLREAFDYPYDQIAEVLQLGPVYTRQLVCRARRHLATDRTAIVSPDRHRRFLQTLIDATRGGSLTRLEDLLAADLAG